MPGFNAKVPVIDLANGSLGLTLKSQKSSGYKVVTEEGIIPLIGLMIRLLQRIKNSKGGHTL